MKTVLLLKMLLLCKALQNFGRILATFIQSCTLQDICSYVWMMDENYFLTIVHCNNLLNK